MKNSIGDFTKPQAKVEEKFAGSTSGPDKNIVGKSTINIKNRNADK